MNSKEELPDTGEFSPEELAKEKEDARFSFVKQIADAKDIDSFCDTLKKEGGYDVLINGLEHVKEKLYLVLERRKIKKLPLPINDTLENILLSHHEVSRWIAVIDRNDELKKELVNLLKKEADSLADE